MNILQIAIFGLPGTSSSQTTFCNNAVEFRSIFIIILLSNKDIIDCFPKYLSCHLNPYSYLSSTRSWKLFIGYRWSIGSFSKRCCYKTVTTGTPKYPNIYCSHIHLIEQLGCLIRWKNYLPHLIWFQATQIKDQTGTAPKLWNSLSLDIRNIYLWIVIKKRWKTYLFDYSV